MSGKEFPEIMIAFHFFLAIFSAAYLLFSFRIFRKAVTRFGIYKGEYWESLYIIIFLAAPVCIAMLVIAYISRVYMLNGLFVILSMLICIGLGNALDQWLTRREDTE